MPDRHIALAPGPVDETRVELTEDDDLRYWTAEFACTAEQLIDALGCVGVDAAAVGDYLAVARPRAAAANRA